jgi:hypothetical protein
MKGKAMKWRIDDDTVAIIFGNHMWGNSRKASLPTLIAKKGGGVLGDESQKRLKLTKQLIVSNEYDRVRNFMAEVKQWVVNRSVPSFFRDGCFLFKIGMVETVDEYLNNQRVLLDAVVDSLVAAYPTRISEAKGILEPDGLFNANDYPTADELRGAFYWDYQWVSFVVPEGLPDGIREAAIERMSNMWEESALCITSALREGFKELITHAVDKLQIGSDGKPKVFRDTFVPNIQEFLETFANRNVTNDAELAALVEKARYIIGGVDDSQVLRDNMGMRTVVRNEFERIKTAMDGMVVDRPRRKFNLREGE